MTRERDRNGYLQEPPWLTEDTLVEQVREKAVELDRSPGEVFREAQRQGLDNL